MGYLFKYNRVHIYANTNEESRAARSDKNTNGCLIKSAFKSQLRLSTVFAKTELNFSCDLKLDFRCGLSFGLQL